METLLELPALCCEHKHILGQTVERPGIWYIATLIGFKSDVIRFDIIAIYCLNQTKRMNALESSILNYK